MAHGEGHGGEQAVAPVEGIYAVERAVGRTITPRPGGRRRTNNACCIVRRASLLKSSALASCWSAARSDAVREAAFGHPLGVIIFAAPCEVQCAKCDAAVATAAAAAQRIVFEKPQTFGTRASRGLSSAQSTSSTMRNLNSRRPARVRACADWPAT